MNEPDKQDDVVVHEFRPLPDRTPEEQVKALTAILHQMAQNAFELRLELNDLKEAHADALRQISYIRSHALPVAGEPRFTN